MTRPATESPTRCSTARNETALGIADGERDIGPDEPGGAEPPPAPPAPEFLAEAGTADIGMPDEEAADELVGDDMDAAEWAALDAAMPMEEQAMPAVAESFDLAAPEKASTAPVPTASTAPVPTRASGRTWRRAWRASGGQPAADRRRGARARGRACTAQGRGLDHRRRRRGLHPAAAAARRRAEPLARGGRHRDERGRRAGGAGRGLPHARPRSPCSRPTRSRSTPHPSTWRRSRRSRRGAAAPGAPQARRAAPAVRSRLTAGRAAAARAFAPHAHVSCSGLVNGLEQRSPRPAVLNLECGSGRGGHDDERTVAGGESFEVECGRRKPLDARGALRRRRRRARGSRCARCGSASAR